MDIYNLSDDEVTRLIDSLKQFHEDITFADPLFGRIKDDSSLRDHKNNIEYIFHRYRHPLENDRFSMHIRFLDNNDILIRLDINNGTHRNPDGEIIQENHIHIYNKKSDRRDAYAYELPKEIKNINSILDAMIDFFEYTKVEYDGGGSDDDSG